jgi:hypothetical protein
MARVAMQDIEQLARIMRCSACVWRARRRSGLNGLVAARSRDRARGAGDADAVADPPVAGVEPRALRPDGVILRAGGRAPMPSGSRSPWHRSMARGAAAWVRTALSAQARLAAVNGAVCVSAPWRRRGLRERAVATA